MFVNDIFKKKQITEANVKKSQPYNEPGWTRKLSKQELDALAGYNEKSIKDIKKEKQDKKQDVKEAGPFSYGAKKPRKGSVADLAAQKRREQEKGRQPIEPKDQRVGVARVTKDVAEGSTQEKLHKRHQELRKKSGLPDPDYYKELKTTYDLPDDERHAKQKEIKQKYKVTNEDREQYIEELQRAGYEIVNEKRMTCPECGGAAYEDRMLAEKQDACYHKVKSRYKVWPSAYASGALVRCRKKGAKNWGNKSK